MHDVISKTLPTPEAELQRRAILELAEADLRIQDAQMQDSAMIEADLTRGATKPAPAAEDPLASFRAALDELIEFTSDDAISAGHALPGGRGCHGPNVSGMERRIEDVLDEVRKIMGAKQVAPASAAPAPDNGLLTSHNPDRRLL